MSKEYDLILDEFLSYEPADSSKGNEEFILIRDIIEYTKGNTVSGTFGTFKASDTHIGKSLITKTK